MNVGLREWVADPADVPVGETMLPEGLRIYAIGDIHGRFDLLETLVTGIRRDLRTSRPARAIEIFLGDYIDRGPHSSEVVEWLITMPPLADERICLMGNHEDWLLKSLVDPSVISNWLFNGGSETLVSYLHGPGPSGRESGDVRGTLMRTLPASHRAFFTALRRSAAYGRYLFVHAGLRPGIPLAEQAPDDLIWIREPFLQSDADFGSVVVHGHTPVEVPDIRANRINIDTGAVFRGRLTCLVLEGSTRRFIQTTAD